MLCSQYFENGDKRQNAHRVEAIVGHVDRCGRQRLDDDGARHDVEVVAQLDVAQHVVIVVVVVRGGDDELLLVASAAATFYNNIASVLVVEHHCQSGVGLILAAAVVSLIRVIVVERLEREQRVLAIGHRLLVAGRHHERVDSARGRTSGAACRCRTGCILVLGAEHALAGVGLIEVGDRLVVSGAICGCHISVRHLPQVLAVNVLRERLPLLVYRHNCRVLVCCCRCRCAHKNTNTKNTIKFQLS